MTNFLLKDSNLVPSSDPARGRNERLNLLERGLKTRCPQVRMELDPREAVDRIDVHRLAAHVRDRLENVLVIDSRSFLEYNTCHVLYAVSVCCSKIVKRRLQQDKMTVKELLVHTCHCQLDASLDVVVYDQGYLDLSALPVDSFVGVLLSKLTLAFKSVAFVEGGFLEFQSAYPTLCEKAKKNTLTALSQPCLPISNHGPTRILPFLYLGSQIDALDKDVLRDHNIAYELNVSTSCPKSDFVQDSHFLRIPVNDNYSEKLLPYFPKAFHFLDKVRESSGCALVHCLAGISRSATVAIAYVMRHLNMSSDDAYRYVKAKRPTISPNFNFLGQLLEYEKQMRRDRVLGAAVSCPSECVSAVGVPLQVGVSPVAPQALLASSVTFSVSSSVTSSSLCVNHCS